MADGRPMTYQELELAHQVLHRADGVLALEPPDLKQLQLVTVILQGVCRQLLQAVHDQMPAKEEGT